MVCRRWPGAGRRRLGGTSRSLSKRAVAGARRGLSRARVGHSSDTRVAKSAYSPEITGLDEWARGELNHLTNHLDPPETLGGGRFVRKPGAFQRYLAVRRGPEAPSGGTCPTRLGDLAPDSNDGPRLRPRLAYVYARQRTRVQTSSGPIATGSPN